MNFTLDPVYEWCVLLNGPH